MKIIDMVEADQNRKSYGILYTGKNVHDVKGSRNRHYPHRVQVWSNVNRPNPHPGETRYTNFGSIGGDGKYLDPQNRGTDDAITVTMGAESMAITNNGTNTGTVASGQVYGETLAMGEKVWLRFPDGSKMGPYLIEARPLHDPHLTPISE